MIDFTRGIWQTDKYKHYFENGAWHAIAEKTNQDIKDRVEAYLLDHPEALIPEPKPSEPTTDEIKAQAIAEARTYLYQTDWIVIKIAEAAALGQDVDALKIQYAPELLERANARARINELEETV